MVFSRLEAIAAIKNDRHGSGSQRGVPLGTGFTALSDKKERNYAMQINEKRLNKP